MCNNMDESEMHFQNQLDTCFIIPFIRYSGKGNNKIDQWLPQSWCRGRIWLQRCKSICWGDGTVLHGLWWWFHNCIHMSKLVELYTNQNYTKKWILGNVVLKWRTNYPAHQVRLGLEKTTSAHFSIVAEVARPLHISCTQERNIWGSGWKYRVNLREICVFYWMKL